MPEIDDTTPNDDDIYSNPEPDNEPGGVGGVNAQDSGQEPPPPPPEPEGDGEGKADDGGQIPGWRLREIREQRDAEAARREAAEQRAQNLERQMAEFQRQQREAAQQQERPDLYSDPEAYQAFLDRQMGTRVKSVEDGVRDRIIDMTFADQHEQHGEVFEKAYSELQSAINRGDPEAQRIINAPNPGKSLMKWHRQKAAMSEVGDDLDGYKAKLRAEWLKDPEARKEIMAAMDAEARGEVPERSNVTAIPSVNRAAGGAHRGAAETMEADELYTPVRR